MKLGPRFLACTLLALCVPLLSGCFGAAVVGVGAGTLMAVDRRASEIYIADEGIEIRAANRITAKFGDRVHVNINSYNRSVLLTGEAPDAATKAEIETIAAGVDGVKGIVNEVEIAGISSFASRSTDTYLTSKVKARFLDAARFSANLVKVVTENGVVYLRGIVNQNEADAAVEIARTTGGVKKVVRVFEIISVEKSHQLDGQISSLGSGAPQGGAK